MSGTINRNGYPKPGDTIAGRYVLMECIGSGGCGDVFSARDTRTGDTIVAIKFMRRSDARCDVWRRRFSSEIQSLKRLRQHAHIVHILDRGEEDGLPFLVMENVDGESLVDWLQRHREAGRRLPELPVVYDLFDQICSAIAHAHQRKIIHRDISPKNIKITTHPSGRLVAKVLDFGIARVDDRRYTQTGEVIGTPGYWSPEQSDGEPARLSFPSDVYSLGVLLVELLTLNWKLAEYSKSYDGSEDHPYRMRTYLSLKRPEIPCAIWDVVVRALQQQPEARYEDAEVLRNAFRRAIAEDTSEPLFPYWPAARCLDVPTQRALRITTSSQPLPQPQTARSGSELAPTRRRRFGRMRQWFEGLFAALFAALFAVLFAALFAA
jgi:serine/threonine protein kinase